ncbi:MAG: fatty acid--CoA ligase family protein, partial [Deltaproteobacteria bacterium]|nr:fatty acid--CoA ligase family protein [Deltaproteobacteria bacterium]
PKFAFPLYILEELARLKITFFSSIPQFYDVAVKLGLGDAPDLSALRLPFCGSAALARATAEAFFAKYGVHIRQGYGLAELSVICVNMHANGRVAYDSVGVPLDGIDWKLDPAGDDAHEGELLVQSKAMFTGYINAPEATRERLEGGWLHTGDIVTVDDHGMFRIVGRKEDFIKVNGLKVYASEVETAIIAVDWIAECAVLGEKDALGAESLVAHLVLRDADAAAAATDASASKAIHDRLARQLRAVLSDYKLPKRTVVWPALPKSPLGKILKSQIGRSSAGATTNVTTDQKDGVSS